MSTAPRTLFDKVWDRHVVVPECVEHPAVLYVDLHLVHEVTSPQAFAMLAARGLKVRRPDRTLATLDHSTPTHAPDAEGRWPGIDPAAGSQIEALRAHCRTHGIDLCDVGSGRRGIVHVVGPEQGRTWPGGLIVCGDSHTSTHGAFGALAFGIGTTEVGHVLATQCLLQRKPKTLLVRVDGELGPGVTAKDLALAVCGALGAGGGAGSVLEYQGAAVRALSMEGRMTLCNMAIEAGARAGMVAPDDVTFDWLRGRPGVPQGTAFDEAVVGWRRLFTDEGARFDREVVVDASAIAPTVTWGTASDMTMPVDGPVPEPSSDTESAALAYMELAPGQPIRAKSIDVVFIGSCTNGRIEDLRAAASVIEGRRVAPGVRMLVVPGSDQVRAQAESEGLDRVFVAAGAEWREPGCSMCIAMNEDRVPDGGFAVSTSNRNFRGRQGPGSRTFLASPETAAASAIEGRVADPRPYLQEVSRA
jgi:3-isopropylmalate/(R)-2-methylmalate dehydratase large subunit